MNISQPVSRLPLARLMAITLLAGSLAASAAEPTSGAPKTHRLFMGSTLAIVSKDAVLPVKDVRQNSFVVSGPRGDLVVQSNDGRFKLKISEALKLTTTFATIDKLSFDRSYTAANDPMARFAETARIGAYLADAADMAMGNLRQAGIVVAAVNSPAANSGNNPSAGAAKSAAAAQLSTAQSDYDRIQSLNNNDSLSPGSASVQLSSDIAAERFDAITVTFKVSAPRPLNTPYVVIFMRFLRDKDHPETATTWVYAEKLPDIDAHPRKITIQRGGFPPGYHIDSYQVHLYEGPAEIATTVSRKRVDLTTAEAFQYSVIDYIGSHRNETRGPAKAAAFWPTDLFTRLTPDQLTKPIHVRVRKDGEALGLYEDESCTRPVADAEIAAVTPELRFLPALEKGKPVDASATIKLGGRPGDSL